MAQRDVWWADLSHPVGATSGFCRPVVVIQTDALNVSRLQNYLCVPLTSNLRLAHIPWNLLLSAKATGLDKDSVAQTHLTLAIDASQLLDFVGRIEERLLRQLFLCLDIALGRP